MLSVSLTLKYHHFSNDCQTGGVLAGHGPMALQVTWANPVPDSAAGFTWDGGPRPQGKLVSFAPFPDGQSRPLVTATIGGSQVSEDCHRFEQVPRLETGDEGAVTVASLADRVFTDAVENVGNPWETFGTIGGSSKLFAARQRYSEWFGATIGVPKFCAGGCPYGQPAPMESTVDGMTASLFSSHLSFLPQPGPLRNSHRPISQCAGPSRSPT